MDPVWNFEHLVGEEGAGLLSMCLLSLCVICRCNSLSSMLVFIQMKCVLSSFETASQTTVLHMKRLNQTESPIFVILCLLCFQRQSFMTFI